MIVYGMGKIIYSRIVALFNLGGKCTLILNFPALHFYHSIGNFGKIIFRRKENLTVMAFSFQCTVFFFIFGAYYGFAYCGVINDVL